VGLSINSPTLNGSQLIPSYYGAYILQNATNTGNTSGTILNEQLKIGGITASAGSGGTMNNYGIYLGQPSGSGAGTTNNYGLYITGNGGGTSNYSIYNNSTALSYLTGSLTSAGTVQAATVNATSGYQLNGTAGATTTCSGGQFLQNQVVQGGITTGGTCASAAAGLTGSGTDGTIAMFSGSGTNLGNSILTQSGSDTLNVGGRLNLQGATGNFGWLMQMAGTFSSSYTGAQFGFDNEMNFNPTGASVGDIYGLVNNPTISGSALAINNYFGQSTGIATASGYTGQITNGYGISVTSPNIGGSKKITNYYGINVSSNSTNGSNTSGTLTNTQVKVGGITAGAGSGGTVTNYGILLTQPSGSGGTTNNYGLYIQGNGGGSTNYAIYSTSTAASLLSGSLEATTINATTGYQFNGTAGSTTTCTGGNILQNTTVQGGIITGGTCVANGAGAATTLQNAYDNSAATNPQIQLSSTNGGLKIRDASSTVGTLFALQDSTGTTSYLAVTSGGASVTGDLVVSGNYNGNTLTSSNLTFSGASTATIQSASSQALNITGNAASTLSTSSGDLTLQGGSGTISLGTTTNLVSTGALTVTAASSLTLMSTGTNSVTLDSGTTGAVNIGTGSSAKTINIGNLTGGTNINIVGGTGTISIGTGATAHTTTIGSSTTTSTTNLQGGNGGLNIDTNFVNNTVQIGNTTSAAQQTFNIGNNTTASSKSTVNIGSTIGTSITTIQAGSGGINLNGSVSASASINATTGYKFNGTAGSTTTCTGGNVLTNAVVQGGIITSGTCAANGGGVAPTLQDVYNNSATTDPQIQLSNSNGGVKLRDAASSTITNLFQIQNSAGSSTYFSVSSTTTTAATFNATTGFSANGTAGANVTCSGGQFLQNQIVAGGIVTGGTCASASGGGVSAVGAIDGGIYSANGASISGTTLFLQTASGTQVGLVNTSAQTFAGAKTFSGDTLVKDTSTTAFQIQSAGSTVLFTADTSTGTITFGTGSNTVIFTASGGLIASGTAQHGKSIVLPAEYAGAVLDAQSDSSCSSANSGTVTSGFDSTTRMNYYNWTATGTTTQCYDVVVQVQIPKDWSSWDGSDPLNIQTKSSGTSNTAVSFQILNASGTADTNYNYGSFSQSTSWSDSASSSFSGTYAAGDVITIKIRMSAKNSANLQIGTITLNYNSKY
jgi:hypothetical protein